jgi:hypothetical protein
MNSSHHKTAKPLIYTALIEISKMGYYKNGAAESGNTHGFSKHEDAIKFVLEKHNLFCEKKHTSCTKKNIDHWINFPQDCPLQIGGFIEQPCGKQNSPDFLLRVDKNWVLSIEAKSSKEGFPMYNSGGIKNNYLYIFCSKKYNQTTFYWGRDIITQEQQDTFSEIYRLQKEIETLQNGLLEQQDINQRGWSYYTRRMINQSGGASKTDYFTHRDRKMCEDSVLSSFITIEDIIDPLNG